MSSTSASWIRPLVSAVALVAIRWSLRGPDPRARRPLRAERSEEADDRQDQPAPSLGALSVAIVAAFLLVAGAVLTTLLGVTGFIVDLDRPLPQSALNWPVVGDPDQGRAAILAYECRACHSVPGMPDLARHGVGPPLGGFAQRAYIAGVLPNDPGNLIAWIVDPPRHSPGTAMPDMGIDAATAADIAAYLYAWN
jgi:cytochrome c2